MLRVCVQMAANSTAEGLAPVRPLCWGAWRGRYRRRADRGLAQRLQPSPPPHEPRRAHPVGVSPTVSREPNPEQSEPINADSTGSGSVSMSRHWSERQWRTGPRAMTFSRCAIHFPRASSRTCILLSLGIALKSKLSRLLLAAVCESSRRTRCLQASLQTTAISPITLMRVDFRSLEAGNGRTA